jgi:hypothetical protein
MVSCIQRNDFIIVVRNIWRYLLSENNFTFLKAGPTMGCSGFGLRLRVFDGMRFGDESGRMSLVLHSRPNR